MGREIRMVPPNWEHPKDDSGKDIPVYDEDFGSAAKEWKQDYALWVKGEHPDQRDDLEYWEWESAPPDRESYRPAFAAPPTWVQMYETVSEGTPVSPAFATKQELVDYLIENGDFWGQSRGDGGWKRAAAESFVEREFAMTAIVCGGKVTMARDQI